MPVNRVTDHCIDLFPDSKPPAHPLYRMSPEEHKELKAQLDQFLADITSNLHAVPTGLVHYLPGKRMEARADKYLLPRIDALLDGLQGSKVSVK